MSAHSIPVHAGESDSERYARHTRNATAFIAVIIGAFVAFAVIGALITIHDLATIAAPASDSTASACQVDPGLPGC